MADITNPVTVLDEDHCWDLLASAQVGRLATAVDRTPEIFPVNYAVDGDTLLFRSAEGSKLLAIAMNPDICFEIDQYGEETAQSVIVRGRARILDEFEEHRAENVPLRPWVPTLKYNVVEIAPAQVTGRAFRLARPWLHARTD